MSPPITQASGKQPLLGKEGTLPHTLPHLHCHRISRTFLRRVGSVSPSRASQGHPLDTGNMTNFDRTHNLDVPPPGPGLTLSRRARTLVRALLPSSGSFDQILVPAACDERQGSLCRQESHPALEDVSRTVATHPNGASSLQAVFGHTPLRHRLWQTLQRSAYPGRRPRSRSCSV
jgi:hypothetical protein